jgi:sec-independent protein translocase protein TatA
MSLGPTELIVILVIVLLLFGSTRLPKLARSLGQASREFKEGTKRDDSVSDSAKQAADPDESVTMTRAELDKLLAEREAAARKEAPPSA